MNGCEPPFAAIDLPPVVEDALLLAWGLLAGSLINLGAAALAWHPRAISPWLPAPAGLPRRTWADRIPLLGWLRLRREARVHGRGFWIRPLAVELITAIGVLWLYRHEVVGQALLPLFAAAGPAPADQLVTANPAAIVWTGFVAHLLLIVLMATASLIDVDHEIIPDEITVPGTLAGLLLALAYPWSLPPAAAWTNGLAERDVGFLHAAAPHPWPAQLADWPGLVLAWACWWAWCLAIGTGRWYGRHGWRRGLAVATTRFVRDPASRLALVGAVFIPAAWALAPGAHWAGLLTALLGMAAGGGIVWCVRIIGSAILRQEAMGFGDVTLLAMIGTFLGWQSCPVIFFLAPLAGVLVGVAQRLAHDRRHIPYGPFLCLAALVVIVGWRTIWFEMARIYEIGWLVPGAVALCFVLLAVLLRLWIMIRKRLFGA